MNRGFTLIETLVMLTLLSVALLFSARTTFHALHQERQAAFRFRLMETGDWHKHYLSSLPFLAPELGDGAHSLFGGEFAVSWQVQTVAPGLKRVRLLAAGGRHSLAIVFHKSNFIQEVKND
jgi:prepilin-type N-terminal cleavage/methylation domain-containing protein